MSEKLPVDIDNLSLEDVAKLNRQRQSISLAPMTREAMVAAVKDHPAFDESFDSYEFLSSYETLTDGVDAANTAQ